jgi:ribonuclease P protein component
VTDARLPKRRRLLRGSEFERVLRARNSAGNESLAIHGIQNDVGHARLGMTVSRRVGNAVARNRWKRCIRESFRQVQHELPALDYVFVARAAEPPPQESLLRMIKEIAAKLERRARAVNRRREAENE